MLVVEDLVVRYGAITAVDRVSLRIEERQPYAVLGANGAGKTSLIKAMLGWSAVASGRIFFDGRDITRLRPWQRSGIAVVPERGRIYTDLTIEENLSMGAYPRRATRTEMSAALELFPELLPRLSSRAGSLSGGQQQMVAIARALMARPRLLIVDEVTSGLAPLLVTQVFAALASLVPSLTLLVAEQNVRRALEITSWATVLQRGRVAITGSAASLRAEPRVLDAYLGGT